MAAGEIVVATHVGDVDYYVGNEILISIARNDFFLTPKEMGEMRLYSRTASTLGTACRT
jgi:hypothetical protein